MTIVAKQQGTAGHLEYLDAMGIQVWQRRDFLVDEVSEVEEAVAAPATEPAPMQEAPTVDDAIPAHVLETPPPFDEAVPPFDEEPPPFPVSEAPVPDAPVSDKTEQPQPIILDWDALEQRVKSCTLCELHQTRTQAVFGVGNREADWLIIGEAPGADEDRMGEPFVGRAGKLLDQMLFAIGLNRQSTAYIANILKCRPPNNRDPKPEEAACCESYLKNQIALIKPKVILAVGRIAAQNLMKTEERIGAMRGKVYTYADTGIPVVVTYHPAYLLRSPLEKRKAWQDLLLAKQVMSEQ